MEIFSEDIRGGKTVEVHTDDHGGYWVGVTIIRSPKDWTFLPRDHYLTESLAIEAAQSLAKGIRFDAGR